MRSLLSLVSFVILAALLTACASTPEGPSGPRFLKAVPLPVPGYTVEYGYAVFESKTLTVAIKPLTIKSVTGSNFLDTLIAEDYIVFLLNFVNTTEDKKVIYNPSHTAMRDNKLSYLKPLDYTDLYSIAIKKEQDGNLNRELKGRFYDSNEIVKPGKKSSKYLIFKPIKEKAAMCRLVLNLIFVGKDSINLAYQFDVLSIDKLEKGK